MDRRRILAWCMYDFGNSAFAMLFPAVFSVYYADTIVGNEHGRGDLWLGRMDALAMLAVALTAPFLGGVADHAGIRKRMLGLYTAAGVGAVLAFGAIPAGGVVTGFLIGALAYFAFEGGTVFYNAYLPDLAPPDHQGRVSAQGFAIGYVGSLVSLGVAALLIHLGLFAWVWPALALQWALASIPTFLAMPADPRGPLRVGAAARRGFRDTFKTLKDVLGMRDLRRYLASYFFFMDAVNTVATFSAVYARKTLGFEPGELLALLATVQVSALLGSVAMAKPTDVRGPKWTVQVTLLWWIAVVAAIFLTDSRGAFWVIAGLAGLGLGSIQAASRAFMSRLIPPGREAEMFGFNALCGKTGSIVGPLMFGAISAATGSQRPAVLCVGVLFLIGLVLVTRVRVPPDVTIVRVD